MAADVRNDLDVYKYSYEYEPEAGDTIEQLMDADRDTWTATFADYAETVAHGQPMPLVMDQNALIGANSPAGPEDGVSTYWPDLRTDLDQQHADAAEHSWFDRQPHWCYQLHDREAAQEYLAAA